MSKVRKILFICEGNVHRSPTAERLYVNRPGTFAKSAGLAASARIQVTDELLAWADVVFVMERRLQRLLFRRFGQELAEKNVVCLDIPDDFQYGQPELVALLTERLAPHLGSQSGESEPGNSTEPSDP